MIYLITVFLSFLITVVVTPYFISYLLKNDIVDKPNGEERRIHTESTPRLGGVLIFLIIILVTFAVYPEVFSRKYFLLGAIVIFITGLYDDLKPIKWYFKFAGQSIAAILLILSLNDNNFNIIEIFGFELYPVLNYIILFILILGMLNSFNLLDGMDGLVSGLSIIIASMCFLLSIGKPFIFLPFLASAVTGTMLGFLKFNANPARIFLGDSGSLTLGYVITFMVFAISGEASINSLNISGVLSNKIDLTFVIIASAVPIADTLRVMLVRIGNKRHPFLADTSHIHHILYSQQIRHKTVVLIIHLFTVSFVLIALYYAKVSKTYAIVLFLVLLTIFVFIKPVVGFILKKEILLTYGRMYKLIPKFSPWLYTKLLIPLVSSLLTLLIVILLLKTSTQHQPVYMIFLIILIIVLFLSALSIRKSNYYAELLVLVNLVLFFALTDFSSVFYKMYPVPLMQQINLNQLMIFIFSVTIVLFVFFRERLTDFRLQYLTGSDLTLAVLILFIYIAVQFINIEESYIISDTLLRSYLVFLFYKIIIVLYQRLHASLYYASFALSSIVVIKSLL
jgi:UDP-GlcNAc:undecaprenyl-phosphate GlcNAc-1-phosphate transferase